MPDWQDETRKAAQRYGLDPNIFFRQIRQESGFDPNARSGAGAIGIAQIMPATARGWGVDPHDPLASLDAAAKNMAGYVKQFGSYRNALVAYNAGPGRVGKPLYGETANYINTILGGHGAGPSARPVSPSTTTSPAGGAEQLVPSAPTSGPTLQSGQGGDYTSVLSSLLGQQQPQQQASTPLAPPAFMAQIAQPHGFHPLEGSGAPQQQATSADPGLLETLRGSGVGVDANAPVSTVDAPAAAAPQTVVQKVTAARKSRGFVGSGVLELIYNGGNDGNGFGIKDGRTVNGSAVFSDVWAGHANHVHVAAGPKTVVELGKLAQKMGLHVGENPHFGGVDPVHVPGSYHYKGEAIDVSGDAKKMALFAQEVADYNKTHKL